MGDIPFHNNMLLIIRFHKYWRKIMHFHWPNRYCYFWFASFPQLNNTKKISKWAGIFNNQSLINQVWQSPGGEWVTEKVWQWSKSPAACLDSAGFIVKVLLLISCFLLGAFCNYFSPFSLPKWKQKLAQPTGRCLKVTLIGCNFWYWKSGGTFKKIAGIANAALNKLPEKSSLNVNFVFPVCPAHDQPDHHDHSDCHDHLDRYDHRGSWRMYEEVKGCPISYSLQLGIGIELLGLKIALYEKYQSDTYEIIAW